MLALMVGLFGAAEEGENPPSPETLAVLILSGPTSGYPLSDIYAATREVLERSTALRVAPLEAIGLDERQAAIRECAGDAACFVRRLRATRDDMHWLLAVSLDRPGEELLLGLRLIDTRTERQVGATGGEVPTGMALGAALGRLLPEVVPPSVWGQVSSLEIRSEPSAAEAQVAGRICVTPCSFDRVPPGRYQLRLRKAGRVDETREVSLVAGRAEQVSVRLAAPESSFWASPWLWAVVGVGVAGVVAGAYALGQEREPEQLVCFSRDRRACDRL